MHCRFFADTIVETIVAGMSIEDQNTTETETGRDSDGIPVRNWWHMLLYAWELVEFKDRFKAEVEDAPDLRALLTSRLVHLTKHQIRRGLRGDYVERSEELRGVRGQIDFTQTLNSMALHRGRLHCQYEEFTLNVPRNQIIRSTLNDSLRRGFTSIERGGAKYAQLISDIEVLLRMLYEIDRVRVTQRLISTQLRQLGRNEREYKLMLKICEMLQHPLMPRSDRASDTDHIDWLMDRENEIFELFVANFYKLRLAGNGWDVSSQKTLEWNETGEGPIGDARLPTMRPDIVLTHRQSGETIVIDTKWYRSVVVHRYDQQTVHSNNLYQMYAYMASQTYLGAGWQDATGILLYARTERDDIDFQTEIDGHPFRVYTLDLEKDWERIESDLLELVTGNKRDV